MKAVIISPSKSLDDKDGNAKYHSKKWVHKSTVVEIIHENTVKKINFKFYRGKRDKCTRAAKSTMAAKGTQGNFALLVTLQKIAIERF